ncbi:MAG: hypothetical protein PWQ41_1192 [Bacillota bacterium]|nr:hypothetical protein [Bacillota bacterium]MDK2925418.1 hypothetical protein [Bacillota bacterium]MDK2959982.1 hypothetical protein [Bacillota bacterium]
MSSAIFDVIRDLAALFATGLAIKLLDDHLDREETFFSRPVLATLLDRGTGAYSLLSYALAARLKPDWALTLFLASYGCGMLGDSPWRLPTRLPAYGETCLVFALGVLATDWQEMTSSAAFILGVQLIDDVLDLAQDRHALRPNLAAKWGRVESALAGIAFVLIGLLLDLRKIILGLAVLPAVLYVARAPWLKGAGKP